ncbi:hypothetical protein M513_10051 [Trichuris suis]|uniref:Uncharacterized protein n=1 Tax=Trichuris suis TaxID=68888 RepID=A0A085LVW3_9BILA|nr:hypothetical protein M513_10051 [Trichuris suis]
MRNCAQVFQHGSASVCLHEPAKAGSISNVLCSPPRWLRACDVAFVLYVSPCLHLAYPVDKPPHGGAITAKDMTHSPMGRFDKVIRAITTYQRPFIYRSHIWRKSRDTSTAETVQPAEVDGLKPCQDREQFTWEHS